MTRKLSDRVLNAMAEHRLSREEMAAELYCSERTLARILAGEIDGTDTGDKYHRILDSIAVNGLHFTQTASPKQADIRMTELEKRLITIELALKKKGIL